jgi:predicted aspartyl protease
MTVLFPYDTAYPGPAFPVFVISVSGRNSTPVHSVSSFVDSGADATIVPLEFLTRVDARHTDIGWARTVTGQRYQVNLYLVTLSIGDNILYGVEVIGNIHTSEVIIGRDVLNQLVVVLDGPGETAEVRD